MKLELPEYSDRRSDCCDDSEYRPAGSKGPWFCMTCGKTRYEGATHEASGKTNYDTDGRFVNVTPVD